MMARKTKATLENDILNLKRDINILTRQKKENEKPKPIYVVYPEKDYCEDWYNENQTDIEKFHSDENNFKYWCEVENENGDAFRIKERERLPNKHNDDLYHWSRFYMHGKLQDEVGYDICDINLQFPFDEQLPSRLFSSYEFIEGLGILYQANAKLTNGKDILIFAFCSLRCSLREYIEQISSNPYEFNRFAQQFGFIKPKDERTKAYRKDIWKLRDFDKNHAGDLGFEPMYPIIPHHWGYWKDYLKKYKLSKVSNGLFGTRYRLDKVSSGERDSSTNINWEGRIIYPDDKESFDHCVNPLEWS